jgi:hypothetical protein
MTPISRKPGLSKAAFGRELAAAGIIYEHRRELGNPKWNPAGFAAEGWQRAEPYMQTMFGLATTNLVRLKHLRGAPSSCHLEGSALSCLARR